MRRGRMFRRRIDGQVEKIQETVGQLEANIRYKAGEIAQQAKGRMNQGMQQIGTYENRLATSIRQNPEIYLSATLIVGALLILWLSRPRADAELGEHAVKPGGA